MIQVDLDQACSSLHGWYYFLLHVLAYATPLPSLVGFPPSPFKIKFGWGDNFRFTEKYLKCYNKHVSNFANFSINVLFLTQYPVQQATLHLGILSP